MILNKGIEYSRRKGFSNLVAYYVSERFGRLFAFVLFFSNFFYVIYYANKSKT